MSVEQMSVWDTVLVSAAVVDRLVPLAQELAAKAGPQGCTVADLRIVAVQRGLLTGHESGRRLSFLGAVMKRAGLKQTGAYRRSPVERSRGNLHVVWVKRAE